jgi:hypothetical protein
MKTHTNLRFLFFLAMLLVTGFMLQAQTKSGQESQAKAEYQKQMQEKEMQLKQMEMQLKEQQLEQQKKMQELERVYEERIRESERSSGRARSFVYATPGESDAVPYFIQSWGQDSQSQLTLRNTFNGETLSSNGEFNVDESASHIKFNASGKVRHGEISIKVFYPNGKVFKDFIINSSAQITYSQSMNIKEEEKKKFAGTWKYEVKTKTAEGSYMMSIMTQ